MKDVYTIVPIKILGNSYYSKFRRIRAKNAPMRKHASTQKWQKMPQKVGFDCGLFIKCWTQ